MSNTATADPFADLFGQHRDDPERNASELAHRRQQHKMAEELAGPRYPGNRGLLLVWG